MRNALRSLDEEAPNAIAFVETQLLGTLILVPYLRLDCQLLRPADFSTAHRGVAFGVIMDLKHPEASLVAHELYRIGAPPPPKCAGWADAIGKLLDAAFVEDDAVPMAVKAIREAAIARRAEARLRRPDAA